MTRISLLLADASACLRLLVLRELLNRTGDDQEVRELIELSKDDSLVLDVLKLQNTDGSWKAGDSLQSTLGAIQLTSQALSRLGYLGLRSDHPSVHKGAEYLFSIQRKDGSWELPHRAHDEGGSPTYSIIPLQTSFPLSALASCGYATDPRAELAYDWLLAQRLPDGAWPTGIASGNYGFVAGYRRLAHSRWGCRSNTTGALTCLALHPNRRTSQEAKRALDLLLGRETREKYAVGFEVARTIGAEPSRGFISHFARFDLAQILDLSWRVGVSSDDERVSELVEFMRHLQGPYGLWEYEQRPQASRWVTFDLLRSLSRLDQSTDWISLEPRTPFQPYPKRQRRY